MSLDGVAYNQDPLYTRLLALPKVDLHTHLNGSISNACLSHLAGLLFGEGSSTAKVFAHTEEEGPAAAATATAAAAKGGDRTTALFNSAATEMDQHEAIAAASPTGATASGGGLPSDPAARMHYCFAVFDAIYKVMNNLDFTRVAVQDVLLHYLAEAAVYVEIRTSIRAGMFMTYAEHKAGAVAGAATTVTGTSTQWDYWKTVTETIADCLTLVDVPADAPLLRLPSYVSALPPFAMVRPTKETLAISGSGDGSSSAYAEGLLAWAQLYGGDASFVGQYVGKLAAEAVRVGKALGEASSSTAAVPESAVNAAAVAAIANLKVRMLLSISRGQSIADGEGTAGIIPAIFEADRAQLAAYSANTKGGESPSAAAVVAARCVFPLLVGIDLGGSAYKGHLPDILALLGRIRSAHQLPMTLHGGEKSDDDEMAQMMAFRPERWGHLVFLSEAHRLALQSLSPSSSSSSSSSPLATKSCVELCLTSNMITNGSSDVSEHHIDTWLSLVKGGGDADTNGDGDCGAYTLAPKGTSHISLHTDDRGVFSASLTKELWLFTQHKGLFPEATFGPIGSAERCEEIYGVVKRFHREALAVAFPPPMATLAAAAASGEGGDGHAAVEAAAQYTAAIYAQYDAAVAAAALV